MPPQQIVVEILQELRLMDGAWVDLAEIDSKCSFILGQEDILAKVLAKRILGDLSLLASENQLTRRKSLLAFVRRLCASFEAALVRKRKQVRVDNKTKSMYSYKILTQ